MSLLKSEESAAELFHNNCHSNKISDIRRILNRLRSILPKNIERKLKISFIK